MLLNYLKIAWRNILRQKWSSAINIFGLSVGLAASMLLYVYISYERSFDRFHESGDKVYRVITHFSGAMEAVLPQAFPWIGDMAKENSPQVSGYCRVKNEYSTFIRGDQTHERITNLMVDPSFPDFFSFRVKSGNLQATLDDPNSVAITEDLAVRVFGDEDPIGQLIQVSKMAFDEALGRWGSRFDPVQVGAVMANPPGNTHLQFDALMSYEAFDPQYAETFSNDVFVFLMIEGRNPDLEAITDIFQAYFSDFDMDRLIITHDLQPLTSIHFGPDYGSYAGKQGNLQLIILFSAVAAFILLIAVINFINLITARSEKRAVEASIRKVSGASRRDIAGQFLGESVLISLISFFLAMVLVEIFLGPFSRLLYRDLSLGWTESLSLFVRLSGFVVIIGLLSGFYPALVFSRFQPAEIMRGRFRGGQRNPMLRIVLVVVQFAISVILIVSITVFNRQVDHMKTRDLGFKPEDVLYFGGLTPSLVSGYEALKAELLQNPRVLYVGSGQAIPGYSGSGQVVRPSDAPADHNIPVTEYRVRRDYREAYQISLSEGRWFDFDSPSDRNNFVVNEAAVRGMNLDDPLGTEVVMWNRTGQIIGVAKDFHWASLREEIAPLIFTAHQDAFYGISVRISDERRDETLEHIEAVFNGFDPNYPFRAWYVSTRFQTFYRQEENQNTILSYASLLAIIIAMLGLLGLSSYLVTARRKEIAVRKVMGATVLQVTAVLFRDIVRWVLLANIIAWPLAWLAMEHWLSNYPYRISVSFWYLLFAGMVSLAVAMLTVSGQTRRAALTNPAEALKNE